jgi:hypothetical protein
VYEVRAADGTRRGLVAVEKGPGGAEYARPERAAVLTLARAMLVVGEPSELAQTVFGLLYQAGVIARPPLGAPYLRVDGQTVRAEPNLALTLDATGRIDPSR